MRAKAVLSIAALLIAVSAVAQQSSQQPMSTASQEPVVKTLQQGAFKTAPGLPVCFTQVVERGDPKTGPYVAFVELATGCTLPWHWHSANEDLLFASGTGQFQAKGQQAQPVSQGAYVYMPSRHQHQLSCSNGCTFHVVRDGAADIHYIDTAGKEISPETALAAVGERPATAVSPRQP